jgi:hypothetical protein
MDLDRVWKSIAAGLCGSVAHSGLMFLKGWVGWLPSFQPYADLQRALGDLIGTSVHPAVPWVLSFANGALVLGFLFGRVHAMLPGRSGLMKGVAFGVLGWLVMGLVFFPLLGRGLFATGAGLGTLPAFFSLLMLLGYSVVMSLAYSVLAPRGPARADGTDPC